MRYEVRSLDLVGNVVDGFETNDARHEGWVMIRGDWTDAQIITALIEAGHLHKHALDALRADELTLESDHGDGLEVSEQEQGWQNLEEESYVDADLDATPDQIAEAEGGDVGNYELVTGTRPILDLQPEWAEGNINEDWKTFWRGEVGEGRVPSAVLELKANPEKLPSRSSGAKKGPQYQVVVLVDGELFGTYNFPEDFEDDDTVLGLAARPNLKGVPLLQAYGIINSPDDVSEQRVALDAFIERGGEALPKFVAGEEDARRIFQAIRKNVNAYSADKQTHQEFSKRQRELWDEAEKLGVSERVRDILRETPDMDPGSWEGRKGAHAAEGRHEYQPYLHDALYADGMRDVANAWDVEYSPQDILAIRRDAEAWAEQYVRRVETEAGGFSAVQSLEDEDWILTPEQRIELADQYRRGAIRGLTAGAVAYAERHGDRILAEHEEWEELDRGRR